MESSTASCTQSLSTCLEALVLVPTPLLWAEVGFLDDALGMSKYQRMNRCLGSWAEHLSRQATDQWQAIKVILSESTKYHAKYAETKCQNRFSSTVLLEGPGGQETNEDISPDTSGC